MIRLGGHQPGRQIPGEPTGSACSVFIPPDTDQDGKDVHTVAGEDMEGWHLLTGG